MKRKIIIGLICLVVATLVAFFAIRSWHGGMYKLTWTTAAAALDKFGRCLAAYEESHQGQSPKDISDLTNWTTSVAGERSRIFRNLSSRIVYLGPVSESNGIIAYLQYSDAERWVLRTNGLSREWMK